MNKPKVIAIVGPTASGKTSLSISLAKTFNGEVVSSDSRQVYKGLDLGTGKVTHAEMSGVPHHLLDIKNATDVYTASDFKTDAEKSLRDITARGKLPIVAGGTFFYLDVLMGKMSTPSVAPDPELRSILETKTTHELYEALLAKDPIRAESIDRENPRRLIRALEIVEAVGTVPKVTKSESPYQWLTLGIDISMDILRERIYQRIIERIEAGMIDEVVALHSHGLTYKRMEDLGLEYRYISRYLQGLLSKDEMITQLNFKIGQFAKRQRMWLKRDKSIVWLPFPVDIEKTHFYVENFLREN